MNAIKNYMWSLLMTLKMVAYISPSESIATKTGLFSGKERQSNDTKKKKFSSTHIILDIYETYYTSKSIENNGAAHPK